MPRWTTVFFVFAVLTTILGFAGMAMEAAGFAKYVFCIFAVLFLAALPDRPFHRA
ncbi:MAG: DUF1328 domain-containing protein [Candidatus Acidiferrales bacterium]